MAVTPSELRRDIYRLLDQVLESGQDLEVERKGRRIRISAVPEASRLDKLVPHPGSIIGDPEDLIHLDWYDEWDPAPL